MAEPSKDELTYGQFYTRSNLVAFHQLLEREFPSLKEKNCAWTYNKVYGKTVPWWAIAVNTVPQNWPSFSVPLGKRRNLDPSRDDLFAAGILPDPGAWYPVEYFERAFLMTEYEAKSWFEKHGLTYDAGAAHLMGEVEYIKPKNITGKFRELTDSERDEWLRPYLFGDGFPHISYKQEMDRKKRKLWTRKGKAPARYGKYSDEQIQKEFCQVDFFRGADILNAKPLSKQARKRLKVNCAAQYGEGFVPRKKERPRRVENGPTLYWTYFGIRKDSVMTPMPQTHKIVFDRAEVKERARLQSCNIVMSDEDIHPHVMYPEWLLSNAVFKDKGIKGKDIVNQLIFCGHTEPGVLYAIKRKALVGSKDKMFFGNGTTGGLRGLELHKWLDAKYPRTNIKYANIPETGLNCMFVLGADILNILNGSLNDGAIPFGYFHSRPLDQIKLR
jgi:hypothetical protein